MEAFWRDLQSPYLGASRIYSEMEGVAWMALFFPLRLFPFMLQERLFSLCTDGSALMMTVGLSYCWAQLTSTQMFVVLKHILLSRYNNHLQHRSSISFESVLQNQNNKIIESFRLENPSKIVKPNLWPCQPDQSTGATSSHFLDTNVGAPNDREPLPTPPRSNKLKN